MANPWRIAGLTTGIGALITILGWFLIPIISRRVSKFFADRSFEAPRKLRQLQNNTIPELKDILMVVEKKIMVRSGKEKANQADLKTLYTLSGDLKSVLYEAEDILDLIDYHRIEKRVTGDAKQSRSSCQKCLDAVGTFIAPWFGPCIDFFRAAVQQCGLRRFVGESTLRRSDPALPISNAPSISMLQSIRSSEEDDITIDSFLPTIERKRLRKRIEDIENILNDSKKSHLLSEHSSSSSSGSSSSSSSAIPEESRRQEEITNLYTRIDRKVFGRDEEREHICSMLRKGSDADGPSSSSRKPYSVFGIHGITGSGKTTLAQYVCDHEKKSEDKHFDPVMFIHVSKTFRLEKIFRDMLSEMGQKSDIKCSVTALRDDLKENLKRKRFLLVLDDLWVNDENQREREVLLDTLNDGQSGSIILVTAQREDAAAALGARKQILIPELEENDYLSLFMHHARPGEIEDDGEYKRIGTKIANKLHRSPIAAVTVGEQLRKNRRIGFWETTANDVMLNETMGALWWSFQQLGADTRRCFAYCSTFPRGYKFKRDELVRIWIAQGFVNTRGNAAEELEDVGNRYIDELLTFSFLMQVQRKFSNTAVFTIHDLLHELAERVAGSDFHRIDLNGSPKDIPAGVRHVFIEANNGAKVVAEESLNLGNLRTLIIKECGTEDTVRTQPMDDFEEVFDCLFKKLRALRVLIVEQDYKRVSVPASVDRMKHLRYLRFDFLGDELILPSTFSKLYHMQTIDMDPDTMVSWPEDMANLVHLRHISAWWLSFPNVGRLTSLQTLSHFRVMEEQGYELKQLKHLNKLRGALVIFGLEIVGSKEEALEAQLALKERLTTLELYFGENTCNDPEVAAEVLEGLCPPKDLEELKMLYYKGSRYPSWMLSRQHPDAPKNLRELWLHCCSRLASIHEESEFFTHLRELRIEWCDWDRLPENMEERLVSLQNFVIWGCKKMELLPTLPQSLREIRILECGELSATCKKEGHENWIRVELLPHLHKKVII